MPSNTRFALSWCPITPANVKRNDNDEHDEMDEQRSYYRTLPLALQAAKVAAVASMYGSATVRYQERTGLDDPWVSGPARWVVSVSTSGELTIEKVAD